jgi:hypothetical protein
VYAQGPTKKGVRGFFSVENKATMSPTLALGRPPATPLILGSPDLMRNAARPSSAAPADTRRNQVTFVSEAEAIDNIL